MRNIFFRGFLRDRNGAEGSQRYLKQIVITNATRKPIAAPARIMPPRVTTQSIHVRSWVLMAVKTPSTPNITALTEMIQGVYG